MTDFAYGTNFVALAAITFGLSGNYASARNIIILVFICCWGLRLALYLFARVLKEGKDARFDGTRENVFKFALFWIAQMVTVWTISIPFTLMSSRPISPALGWQDGLGIALFVIGFVIETVSDAQKFHFKNSPGNRSKMCTIGLWRYSRHPNYFGESLVWWGIWSMCTSVFNANPGGNWMYFSIFSPVYVCALLLFASGIPTLEGPWDKRYGKDPEYRAYKKSVPPYVPFIPALYAKMPSLLKCFVCFEFPFYSTHFPSESADLESSWEKGQQPIGSQSYQNV